MYSWIKNYFWESSIKKNLDKEKYNEIYFPKILVLNIVPDSTSVKEKEFIKVIYKGKPYWAIFRCPCGCAALITLPLQKSNHHFWHVFSSKNDRPSVYPSVWQNKGCCSHFVINDGKIIWFNSSGMEPYTNEELY